MREGGLEGGDCCCGFLGRAPSDVDFGVFGVEDFGEFEADPGVAACYDEDLGRLLVG
jgi:hypothetical protein